MNTSRFCAATPGPRFGGTGHCVIVDCEDNDRADRPVPGHRAFREIWKPRRA